MASQDISLKHRPMNFNNKKKMPMQNVLKQKGFQVPTPPREKSHSDESSKKRVQKQITKE